MTNVLFIALAILMVLVVFTTFVDQPAVKMIAGIVSAAVGILVVIMTTTTYWTIFGVFYASVIILVGIASILIIPIMILLMFKKTKPYAAFAFFFGSGFGGIGLVLLATYEFLFTYRTLVVYGYEFRVSGSWFHLTLGVVVLLAMVWCSVRMIEWTMNWAEFKKSFEDKKIPNTMGPVAFTAIFVAASAIAITASFGATLVAGTFFTVGAGSYEAASYTSEKIETVAGEDTRIGREIVSPWKALWRQSVENTKADFERRQAIRASRKDALEQKREAEGYKAPIRIK